MERCLKIKKIFNMIKIDKFFFNVYNIKKILIKYLDFFIRF